MESLEDHFEKLGASLKSQGVPAWEKVLVAEDLHIYPFSRQSIERSAFHELHDFSGRFEELQREGHNWLNLSGLGVLDGVLIVTIEKPKANAGSPTTAVNHSGPPSCVRDNGYDLGPFIEIQG